ncbi:Nucleoside diphosphate kinase 7 [Portunus trituberculatus]|uniref:Nucleoside diphosphate kinase 7 n=1 Tax=Portunus trituberculatus TaxID=210409 RepID=A0A5B7DB26_PORTR|nr:Nucleoside diphosphate kinase 7 [Portunus trituberculatus]
MPHVLRCKWQPEEGVGETRYIFHTEWYDPVSATVNKFHLSFFPRDRSVEMYDLRAQRLFLKRIPVEGVEERDLYLGNTIVVLSRQLKITDYADAFTRDQITSKRQSILKAIKEEEFDVSALQIFRMDKVQSEEFLEVYKGVVSEYPGMVQQLMSGPLVALEITSRVHGSQTPTKFREFVGPADPEVARELRPNSLRARFGEDTVKNALHCSDLPDDGPLEVEYFFKILQ